MNFIGGPFDGLKISLVDFEIVPALSGNLSAVIPHHGVTEITLRRGDVLHRYEYQEEGELVHLPPDKYLNGGNCFLDSAFVYVTTQ